MLLPIVGKKGDAMENKNAIQRFADKICLVEKWVMTAIFLFMLALMFIQVFSRYVLQTSLAWSEEAMRFSFILASYLGAAVATHQGQHVVINFLTMIVNKVMDDTRRRAVIFAAFDIVVDIVSAAFCIYIAWVMGKYSGELNIQEQLSTAMLIPMWYIGYGITASLSLCAFHFLVNLTGSVSVFFHRRKEAAEL